MQHSHCSYCGTAFATESPWPRLCVNCGETTWRNPLPVAVVLLPVVTAEGQGLLLVRRDIEPCRGQLSLPGGFIEIGETWREAAVRELHEETTITADPDEVALFDVHSAAVGLLIVFGLLPPRPLGELPPSTPTEEATGYLIAMAAEKLAFPSHTRATADYFASA